MRAAWSRHRQSFLRESLLARQAAEQVERAWTDFQAGRQKLKDLETQVVAAREAFRIASDRYDAGDATNLDRLDAQDQLQSAQLRYESERYLLMAAGLNLRRLAGEPMIGPASISGYPATAPCGS